MSEANAGYHFDVAHGLNVDAGIFVSYIGLFSYYNFDNWTYQPSYVSSNTPWFFNGLRIQYFPTNTLKIEPWLINGWQSYGRYNKNLGFGGQILWQPTENVKWVFNNYGVGEDNLAYSMPGGPPNSFRNANRVHTDDSLEYKFYDNKMNGIVQSGLLLHIRCGMPVWGRSGRATVLERTQQECLCRLDDVQPLLVRQRPIRADPWRRLDEQSGPVLDPAAAHQRRDRCDRIAVFHGKSRAARLSVGRDAQFPVHAQAVDHLVGAGFRHSSIPYFAGQGGVTPPLGNNGNPSQYVCNDGAAAGTTVTSTSCANDGGVWYPDLRTRQAVLSGGVLVKF